MCLMGRIAAQLFALGFLERVPAHRTFQGIFELTELGDLVSRFREASQPTDLRSLSSGSATFTWKPQVCGIQLPPDLTSLSEPSCLT